MSKNKKSKLIPVKAKPLSPENYIKTQARLLPVYECLITEGWQDTGICNIMVARRHKTGNITFGIYLIDLYCLGLKDTQYQFNTAEFEYEGYKDGRAGWVICDYVLAHNIIYGGIAYAEDYGFKPDPNFAVAQFILEEDDENVELMEIEFGLNGSPCYMRGPYDSEVKIKNITDTLMRTAGQGNFNVVDSPGLGDAENEDEEDEVINDPHAKLMALVALMNLTYDELMRTPEARELLEKRRLGKHYTITRNAIEHAANKFDNEKQGNDYQRLRKMVFNNEFVAATKELEKIIKVHPDKPLFYNLLYTAYSFCGETEKEDAMIVETYQKFPDYLFGAITYASMLIDDGKPEGIPAIFKGKADLHEIYPERKLFHATEAAVFYGVMCRYFVTAGDIDSADLYMNAILEYDLTDIEGQTMTQHAIKDLYEAKMKRINEVRNMEGYEE